LATLHSRLARMLAETQQEVDEVNTSRKRDQGEALGNLSYLQSRFVELSFKTREIEAVCVELERQIQQLEERKEINSRSTTTKTQPRAQHENGTPTKP